MGGQNGQSSKVAMGAAMLAALCLAGCPAARRAAPPSAPGTPPVGAAPPAAGATRYRVVSDESSVIVLAYRGGALASLGHNHVIASKALTGVIDLREPLTASGFELRLPVATFTVDDAPLRSGRGPEFAPAVPESAREGTRRNMLGEALLDAGRFPQIVAHAVALTGGPRRFEARVELEVRGERHVIEAPVQVDRHGADRLRVTARFPVTQGALGLAPYSVMLGALRVEDRLDVEVDLSARRVP
ncbi:MAG: YceI family protein [Steroidobacteraceae bacterium]